MRVRHIQSRHAGLMLLTVILVGCTTTTRSVNESPRDPQVQRQSQQQTPARAPTRTPSPPPQQQSRSTSSQTLSASQMNQLVQAEVDQLLQRGVTSSQQVVQIFGQPHGMTRSGEELFWNYTHQFRDESRNVGGMKSLTILFDTFGRVLDYDFQDNTYTLD